MHVPLFSSFPIVEIHHTPSIEKTHPFELTVVNNDELCQRSEDENRDIRIRSRGTDYLGSLGLLIDEQLITNQDYGIQSLLDVDNHIPLNAKKQSSWRRESFWGSVGMGMGNPGV